jgi:hypothetical protein
LWLSGLLPYEQAEAVLREVGRVNISRDSIWRMSQKWGARFGALEDKERQQAHVLPEKGQPPSRGEADRRMGVAMDGMMLHIRQEGWKELKLGAVFDLAVRPEPDERTQEPVELAHAVNTTFVAHLGGPEMLGQLLWAEAHRRKWDQAQDSQAIGDGAVWIWNLVAWHFPGSRQLVDWYHAKQHLAEAARLFRGEGTTGYTRWFKSRETALYQGQADKIACELEQATPYTPEWADDLRREAGYFRQNAKRMNYLEMREEEYVVGSGMVEGGAKQYQARLCGPGMHWSRTGAAHLIPVRTAILSHRFDDRWREAQNLPQT